MRGKDIVAPQVLMSQLNNIEEMITKHNVAELSSNLRVLADWFDMQDQSGGLLDDGVQKDLHLVANLLSAINKEACI